MWAAIWGWTGSNAGTLSVLVATVPILWAVVQFIVARRAEAKRLRFETFHRLVKELVEREVPEKPMMLDRQIAVVYELRSLKHYYPVTLRILRGCRNAWTDAPDPNGAVPYARLLHEIDLAIAAISPKVSRADRRAAGL